MGNEVECMEVVKLRGLRLKSGQVKTEEVEMLKQIMEMSYILVALIMKIP